MTRHRSWWGWGWEDAAVEGAELDRLAGMLAAVLGDAGTPRRAPAPEDLGLRAPRVAVPDALAGIADGSDGARAGHSHGQSLSDVVAMLEGDLPDPCDWVLRPAAEDGVAAVLDWCTAAGIAAIPWGGGTSVVGGVTPDVGDGYPGVVSLDLGGLDRVLEVDLASRAVRVQAGMLGPALEEALRPHGLTLRHQPQSYEFSSVGGWLATRSAGHHSTLHTHLDDRVEGMRALTPRGALETRRLPASGAGPSPDRLLLGSEGTLAVITEAWLRLVERPLFRARASVRFATFPEGAAAARALGQSMLLPATCRLVDAAEAFVNRVGDGSSSLLLLGFEAAGHPVDAALRRALELCADHGGTADPPPDPARDTAGTWRDAFVRLPYVRDAVARLGHTHRRDLRDRGHLGPDGRALVGGDGAHRGRRRRGLRRRAGHLPPHPRLPRRLRPLLHGDRTQPPRRPARPVGPGQGGGERGDPRRRRHHHPSPRRGPRPPALVRPPAPRSRRHRPRRGQARPRPRLDPQPRGAAPRSLTRRPLDPHDHGHLVSGS